jgi:lambda family phage minor tail protein L
MSILGELQTFGANTIVEMFVLDLTTKGGDLYYFHAGTNALKTGVVWQGNTYTPLPLEVTGFEMAQGKFPRPQMRLANISGVFSTMVRNYSDLVGCKVTRKRTMARYLDAVNFSGGNPNANPLEAFPDDIFYITRKTSENKLTIEFELGSSLDLMGVMLPKRQVIANVCPFVYRSENCGYAGGAVATNTDTATTDITKDACSHKVSGCKLRFGENGELSFGGFVGAALIEGM